MLTVVKVVQLRGRSRELMSPLARTDPLSLLEQDPCAALWLCLCSALLFTPSSLTLSAKKRPVKESKRPTALRRPN